jgi:hypothetical protein
MIICLFKRWLFLIKPEDLFDLSGFGSAKAKHAGVDIMSYGSIRIHQLEINLVPHAKSGCYYGCIPGYLETSRIDQSVMYQVIASPSKVNLSGKCPDHDRLLSYLSY